MLAGDLEARFANIRDALPAAVVLLPHGDRFHRQALAATDPTPACSANGEEWVTVDLEPARHHGYTCCTNCFRALVEEAARDPQSPVALRDAEVTDPPAADGGVQLRAPPSFDPVLRTRTEEVAVTAGQSTMHAPVVIDAATPGVPTLCGREADRIVERRAVEATYEDCRDCFVDE